MKQIDILALVNALENDQPSMHLDGLFWRFACQAQGVKDEWLSETYFMDSIERQLDKDKMSVDPPAFTTSLPAEFFGMVFHAGLHMIAATHTSKGPFVSLDNPITLLRWHSFAPSVPQAACAALVKALAGNATYLFLDL